MLIRSNFTQFKKMRPPLMHERAQIGRNWLRKTGGQKFKCLRGKELKFSKNLILGFECARFWRYLEVLGREFDEGMIFTYKKQSTVQ